jgi:uncharacterized protein YPO0396
MTAPFDFHEYYKQKLRERGEESSKVGDINFMSSDFDSSKKHYADKDYRDEEFSGIESISGNQGKKELYANPFEQSAEAIKDISDIQYYEDQLYAAGKKKEQLEALQRAQKSKSGGPLGLIKTGLDLFTKAKTFGLF